MFYKIYLAGSRFFKYYQNLKKSTVQSIKILYHTETLVELLYSIQVKTLIDCQLYNKIEKKTL